MKPLKIINIIFITLVISLLAALIFNTLNHIFGAENVYLTCVIIVGILGIAFLIKQLIDSFLKTECSECNKKIYKHNVKYNDLFDVPVCDEPDCLISAWNRERELEQ